MVNVLERRKQRTMKIVRYGRFYVQRWEGLDSEFLQPDGQWQAERGDGYDTAKDAQHAAEPHWPTTIGSFCNLTMSFDELLEIVHEAGYPTEGYLAEWLWRHLNVLGNSALSIASEIYTALGYNAFEGYPLKRL